MDNQWNAAPSSGTNSDRNVHVNGADKKAQSQEQQEAEKHLQMRVEAQEKYMRSMMEKAHQALASGATWPAANEQAKISPPGRK
ncbi:Os06g0664900 [Oryza sativa Japonica Group]|uniref:Os06g0664900 protein n=3 Tax=Oryza sativa TaxID=4530 RepID=A0A0P0WZV4_ORYSJ|nr:hypothetical protein OsI_24024 [Oryza sativa Indica Group]EAZ37925.1 hypothetical protein OsJ_22276 [Oryza sativa Japonica Group]KAB8103443.1 hypothetical protein EE612_035884 [Oryza sativa]BAD45382.1 hypothetical protein [Oryza sativa Japonica Group]BAS99024.1 Os06g0664900 [Oryza sativa Japonica Group]